MTNTADPNIQIVDMGSSQDDWSDIQWMSFDADRPDDTVSLCGNYFAIREDVDFVTLDADDYYGYAMPLDLGPAPGMRVYEIHTIRDQLPPEVDELARNLREGFGDA